MKISYLDKTVILTFLFSYCAMNYASDHGYKKEKDTDAIQYIVNAIDEYPIVCIGEYHGSVNLHEFLSRLFANDTLQDKLDVIIVEFINATYQSLIDDYILGKDVSFQQLSNTWRNTCISPLTTWDSPLYYNFLQRIREINKTRTSDNKIRVLGGDPPINWSMVKSMADIWPAMSQRNSYPAQLAIEQAIDKKKKVLILFGAAHLTKVPDVVRGKKHQNIVTLIQDKYPGKIKVISTINTADLQIEDRISEFQQNYIYELDMHWLGDIRAGRYFPEVYYPNGEKASMYEGFFLKDIFDALIYIGSQSKWEILSAPRDVIDDEYWKELNRRNMILYNEPIDDTFQK